MKPKKTEGAPTFDYDLLIVGGGPAGATLARLAAGQGRVLLIDNKHEGADSFRKVCGGLLSEDAQDFLARHDMTLPNSVLADPQIFSVKTIDLGTGAVCHYRRSYLNLDRHRFDLWLLSLVPKSVERLTSRVGEVRRLPEGFAVETEGRTLTCRTLVGADGANSLVRRSLFKEKKVRSYVAIQQWFPSEKRNPYYSCLFDAATSDCCSWTIAKDDFFIYGGAFAPKDCRAQFEKQKERLKRFGFTFGTPLRTEACAVLRPASFSDFFCGRDGAFLIGEAAGFISPSSLEGFSYAFNSAEALSKALASGKSGEALARAYRKNTLPLRMKLWIRKLKSHFMYVPFLRRLVMKSRLTAMDVTEEAP